MVKMGVQLMDKKVQISNDDLMGFVSGSLGGADFARVSLAVSKDSNLQNEVAALEMLRSRLAAPHEPVLTDADNEAAALRALSGLGVPHELAAASEPPRSRYVPTKHENGKAWKPKKMRWFYGAFAAQTLCLVWLAAGMLPSLQKDKPVLISAADSDVLYRGMGIPAGSAVLVVNFAPDATEKQLRGLLLDAGANIVFGPNQLGEYRISVAGNLADAAFKKLQGTALVESVKVFAPAKP
jgi:hypothetical protein